MFFTPAVINATVVIFDLSVQPATICSIHVSTLTVCSSLLIAPVKTESGGLVEKLFVYTTLISTENIFI